MTWKGPNEADLGGVAFHCQRGLGHFKSDQVVRGQRSPNLLIDAVDRFAAQGQRHAQHALLEFPIARRAIGVFRT